MSSRQERVQLEGSASSPRRFCSLCNKTFERESSAKRHFYYCRSKLADTGSSRRRSCGACARAKTRCIWPVGVGLGACTRCDKRNITCDYDTSIVQDDAIYNESQDITLTTGAQENRGVVAQETSTTLVSTRRPIHDETTLIDTSYQNPLHMATTYEWGFIDNVNVAIDDLDPGIEFLLHSRPNSMSLTCSKIANLPATRTSPPAPWKYQPLPAPLFSTRSFTRPDHVALVSLGMRILRSYPYMMLAKDTPPPFINSSVYTWAQPERVNNSRKSLVSCSRLVQNFKSHNATEKGSWAWGQIWYEQEKILAEYLNFDRWELLEALQTLLIFCLLRLQDAPAGHAVFDVSLLTTVNVVSQALGLSVGEFFDCSISEDPAVAWRDWIFLESRRRTVFIFQILGLLVDISTAVSYFSLGGLVLAPLPSSTALWCTHDFERWKPEYNKWRRQHTIYALSETGKLTRLTQSVDGGLKSSLAEWEEWSAEVGELSTLVMIVGELLKD